MDETRARRTLVTNWGLLHKEPGLKISPLNFLNRKPRICFVENIEEVGPRISGLHLDGYIFFNSGRDNDYNTLTGQDMKLSSEPTWDSAMISARRMAKTVKDSV